MGEVTFHDKVFGAHLEGKVVAEVKLKFLPIQPLSTDKEHMAYDRVAVRLDQLAKQAELQLEKQVNAELAKLEGRKEQ